MLTPAEVGLTFLVLTNQFWGKNDDLHALKLEASKKGVFKKGEKRVYHLFLVHHDTIINDRQEFIFPSTHAEETAISLGVL